MVLKISDIGVTGQKVHLSDNDINANIIITTTN